VRLLQTHKRKQAELKMKNRTVYADYGLIFAQAWEHHNSKHSVLGAPLDKYAIHRRLTALCADAKVPRIVVHGTRHTCATMFRGDGGSPSVVAERLGHKNTNITMGIYSHALPSMRVEAARHEASRLDHRTISLHGDESCRPTSAQPQP
jgi:integrase